MQVYVKYKEAKSEENKLALECPENFYIYKKEYFVLHEKYVTSLMTQKEATKVLISDVTNVDCDYLYTVEKISQLSSNCKKYEVIFITDNPALLNGFIKWKHRNTHDLYIAEYHLNSNTKYSIRKKVFDGFSDETGKYIENITEYLMALDESIKELEIEEKVKLSLLESRCKNHGISDTVTDFFVDIKSLHNESLHFSQNGTDAKELLDTFVFLLSKLIPNNATININK